MMDNRVLRGMVLGLALVLASVLAACGGAEGTDAPVPEASALPGRAVDLEGSEWNLAKFKGADLVPGTNISVSFDEGSVGGFAGCNTYGGTYETAGEGALSISALQMTLMACLEPEGVMEQEDAYLAALQEAAAYTVNGYRLEIEDGAGELLLVFAR